MLFSGDDSFALARARGGVAQMLRYWKGVIFGLMDI